jgi:hypothetical protein
LSQSWQLHHHKVCWQIKETAKPQRVPMPHNNGKQGGTISSNMTSKGCARYCISYHPRGCWSAGIHTTPELAAKISQPFAAKTFWQDKPKHTTQHSPVISSLFVDHLNIVT